MEAEQFPEPGAHVREIPAAERLERLEAGEAVTILDTRRPADFEAWTLTHSNVTNVNVPFTEFLTEDGDPAEADPDRPVITCCAKGISSLYVVKFLARQAGRSRRPTTACAGGPGSTRLAKSRLPVRPGCGNSTTLLGSSGLSRGLGREGGRHRPAAGVRDAVRRGRRRVRSDAPVRARHPRPCRPQQRPSGRGDADRAEPFLPAATERRGLAFDATLVEDGDGIRVGHTTIHAVHIPGHTSEITGYRAGDGFVTGDTMFTASVARPDLEAGSEEAADAARQLHDTLRTIAELPDDAIIAPGHTGPAEAATADGTYPARLGDLRESLPAFSQDRETFVEATVADMPPRPNDYREITATNFGRESVVDEAFELELGPNDCAATAD